MRVLPGGIWYEPNELGLSNILVPAASTVFGNIVPWNAVAGLRRVVVFFQVVSGTGTPFDVNFRPFDADGLSPLDVNQAAWTGIPNTSYCWWADDNTPRPKSGASSPTISLGLMMGSPFMQPNIDNNDVANGANVSLRILLARS